MRTTKMTQDRSTDERLDSTYQRRSQKSSSPPQARLPARKVIRRSCSALLGSAAGSSSSRPRAQSADFNVASHPVYFDDVLQIIRAASQEECDTIRTMLTHDTWYIHNTGRNGAQEKKLSQSDTSFPVLGEHLSAWSIIHLHLGAGPDDIQGLQRTTTQTG